MVYCYIAALQEHLMFVLSPRYWSNFPSLSWKPLFLGRKINILVKLGLFAFTFEICNVVIYQFSSTKGSFKRERITESQCILIKNLEEQGGMLP